MASSHIAGTFANGSSASIGHISDVCIVPAGCTSVRLTATGLNAQNSVKAQRRSTPGTAFSDLSTYTSDQSGTSIAASPNDEVRLVVVAMQAIREIRFSLTAA